MPDYSEPLLILKEWTRRYSDNMRDQHFEDAIHDAIQISKASLECIKQAKALHDAQIPTPTDMP